MAWNFAVATLVLLAVAGMAGGLIAARLPYSRTMDEFLGHRIGFWPTIRGGPLSLSPRFFMALEHWAFWLALMCGASAGLTAASPDDLVWNPVEALLKLFWPR